MRVAVLGNAIYDYIDCDGHKFTRDGGVFNITRANGSFDVYTTVGHDEIGSSLVRSHISNRSKSGSLFVNRFGNTSTASIKLQEDGASKELLSSSINEETLRVPALKYSWIHISYLNKIKVTDFVWSKIRDSATIISGDSCAGDCDFDKQVDILFHSADEPCDIGCEIKVSHSPTISKVSDELIIIHENDQITDRHILGAGDYFVSNFITSCEGMTLDLIKTDISSIIKKAHSLTSTNIKNFNV
jgi:hypothetical protein